MSDDPETEVALTRAAPEVPLAWSADDGDDTVPAYDGDDDSNAPTDLWSDEQDRRYSWGTVRLFVGLIGVAVVAAGWAGGLWAMHRHNRPAPAAQLAAPSAPDVIVPSTPAPPPGPKLDGTYQLVFDIGAATYSGHAAPPKRTGVETIWWAFRSSCTPVSCTASGVKLDNTDHTVRSAKNITDTFTFVHGLGGWPPLQSRRYCPRLHR
jgi:hypothetical protein